MSLEKPAFPAFNPAMWKSRSEGGYDKLGWVNAKGPLETLIVQADIQGHETVVDLGTGSQAVLKALSPFITSGHLIGFDISPDMLKSASQPHQEQKNPSLFVASAEAIPLADCSSDIVTARMVFHHLPNIPQVVSEIHRILKPNGKMIIGEYVASDDEVLEFERVVFDIKEAGRHLWTGEQMAEMITDNWPNTNNGNIILGYGLMPQYSVKDWMGKSGLDNQIQEEILKLYINAPDNIVTKMGITYTANGDALVDRPFAFVSAIK